MKNYKVTVNSASGSLTYEIRKTLKGAQGFANKLANDAFYGEEVEIIIEELQA